MVAFILTSGKVLEAYHSEVFLLTDTLWSINGKLIEDILVSKVCW